MNLIPGQDLVSATSRAKIVELYPGIRPLIYRVLQDVFTTTRRRMNIVEGMRSPEYQLALYAKGRKFTPAVGYPLPPETAPPVGTDGVWSVVDLGKIVTNAKPGLSWHSYGLAIDCAWAGMDPWLEKETLVTRQQLWAAYANSLRTHAMVAGADFHLVNGVQDIDHGEKSYGLTIPQAVDIYETHGLHGVWAYCDQIRGVPQGQDWGLGG